MAELVDAADLKSVGRKAVPVRFRPSAPIKKPPYMGGFLIDMIHQSIEAAQCRFEPQFTGGYIRRSVFRVNKVDKAILLRSPSGRENIFFMTLPSWEVF